MIKEDEVDLILPIDVVGELSEKECIDAIRHFVEL